MIESYKIKLLNLSNFILCIASHNKPYHKWHLKNKNTLPIDYLSNKPYNSNKYKMDHKGE